MLTSFGVMAFVALSGHVVKRHGQPKTIAAGLLLAATGNVMLAVFHGEIIFFTFGIAVLGFGFMLAHSVFVAITTLPD